MTVAVEMELGAPLPEDPELEERIVAVLGAVRAGQLLALSFVAIHRTGVVDVLTAGSLVEHRHQEPSRVRR